MANSSLRIHLATGNAHKVQEFQQLAATTGLCVGFVPAAGMPNVIEDTGTFIGNARKKALALKTILPSDAWVLADDSGLCVDALGGAPGVESAYFAGPQHDSIANLRKLTEVMRNVPEGKRGAYFCCVLVLLGRKGAENVFEGRCEGVLAKEPSGGNGFGYDPLFVANGFRCTYAQLGEIEKNRISHRGRAFAEMSLWWTRFGRF